MVKFTIENDIACLAMDNGKANTFDVEQIDDALNSLNRARSEAKAVVLTGTSGMFTAGFDLKEIEKGEDAVAALMTGGRRLIHQLLSHPQPVVAACSGHAVALGAILLLACDTRIGANGEFKIGLSETRLGLTLPVFALELVNARIEKARQRNVVLEAQMYDPAAAVDLGFLDELVTPDQLMGRALGKAMELAEFPADAYKLNKADLLARPIEAIRNSM